MKKFVLKQYVHYSVARRTLVKLQTACTKLYYNSFTLESIGKIGHAHEYSNHSITILRIRLAIENDIKIKNKC